MTSAVLTSIVSFIVAIGVLVAVHEYGHFWAARKLGFKVLRFSIGFGRPLARKVGSGPDHTEYVIAAVPLGGYVKMLDEREGPLSPEDRERSFQSRPPLARIAVLLAGPGFNFLFALVAFWVLYMNGVPGLKPVVGEVTGGSPAAEAGLRPEQTILRVGDEAVATREAAVLGILDALVSEGGVPLVVADAEGRESALTLFVPPEKRRELTEPGALLGDEILAAGGVAVGSFSELVDVVRARPGETVTFDVRREGRSLSLDVAVEAVEEDGKTVGRIGMSSGGRVGFPDSMRTEARYGPFAALAPAARETWSKTALTVKFLWRMVTGDVSTKNISGPINIAQYAGLSALGGLTYFLGFMALISISLGVLNLLPIPILDGGQVLYQVAEMIKGRPLSDEAQVVGQKVGIAFLVALMGFAFYNDIARLIG
jgi:regulator of sigma E protease